MSDMPLFPSLPSTIVLGIAELLGAALLVLGLWVPSAVLRSPLSVCNLVFLMTGGGSIGL
jgi:uncharacterized membrane protein YphA (DoxX/SURF4 family)